MIVLPLLILTGKGFTIQVKWESSVAYFSLAWPFTERMTAKREIS